MTSNGAAATTLQDQPAGPLRVSILHVPDCPLVEGMRADVELVLASLGTTAEIEEIEGPYPSPTLLVAGVEIEGYPLGSDPACRIDLPTREEIVAAILAAGSDWASHGGTEGDTR